MHPSQESDFLNDILSLTTNVELTTIIGVRVLCDVAWSLSETDVLISSRSYKSKTGNKYRNIEFKVIVRLGNADLSFGVECGNEKVACEAKYPDD